MTFRVIPVPIPNTEVKPKCAENTCGLPCWEDRLLLDFFLLINIKMKNLVWIFDFCIYFFCIIKQNMIKYINIRICEKYYKTFLFCGTKCNRRGK